LRESEVRMMGKNQFEKVYDAACDLALQITYSSIRRWDKL